MQYRQWPVLPGAVALPAGYFWRVTNGTIGLEVHVRRKRKIGSKRIGRSFVNDERHGTIALERAVKRAYEDFLDKTTNTLISYFGDYR
jgi:hypothetical protein